MRNSIRHCTCRGRVGAVVLLILFHPDYTVGPGITPDLLTHGFLLETRGARGLGVAPFYRRWGIAPRPENTGTTPARSS